MAATQSAHGRPFDEATSIDDQFTALAAEIPGFGGFVFDRDGRMVVVLADTSAEFRGRAVQVLTARFGNHRFSLPGGRQRADIARARFVRGRYDFARLRAWRDAATDALFAVPGMTFLDIDEASNRIRVGARDAQAERELRSVLAREGIPADAVLVELIPPFEFEQKLTSPFTTMVGGIQVQSTTGSTCTHGPVSVVHNGYTGANMGAFVTASHCTGAMGNIPKGATTTSGAVFHQPTVSGGPRIGVEIQDPPFWGGPNVTDPYGGTRNCPENRRCRSSDAALVRYDPGIAFGQGRIARTALNDSTITGTPFEIVDELHYGFGAYEGETLTKVGRSTGRTQGVQASSTCTDLPTERRTPDGYLIVLLCQHGYEAASQGGDSGAPVFFLGPALFITADQGYLAGMHIGSSGGFAVYSASYYISNELNSTTYGTLTYSTVWP